MHFPGFTRKSTRRTIDFRLSIGVQLNGVFVNGTRILGETLLNDGDIVGFGTVYVRFVLESGKLQKEKEKNLQKVERFPVAKLMDSRNFQPEKSRRYLDFLYGFTQKLLQQFPSSDLGEIALDMVQDLWSVDRSCLMLRDPNGDLAIVAQRFGTNPQLTGETLEISTSLIREFEKNEEALLVPIGSGRYAFRASESLQRQNVNSVMCAPLWNNRKIHGFLYADLILSERSFNYGDLRNVCDSCESYGDEMGKRSTLASGPGSAANRTGTESGGGDSTEIFSRIAAGLE